MELIIGLPTIQTSFRELFVEMINAGVGSVNIINANALDQEEIHLGWSPQESEEEETIPEPKAFNLMYLEGTYEEALEKFLEMLPSKISPEFGKVTEILKFLESAAKDVFVPKSWTGINGIDPIELSFKPDMPKRIKPALRRIPAAIAESTRKECERMRTYFFRPSTSPVSSPLVVAPKATYPFVRLCGDYRVLNKYIESFHYPIPHVIHQLHRVAMFNVFSDLDVTNAFHGLRIGDKTSRMLSVQTPYGQFEPIFLPEGVSPASLILMANMAEIFADFAEWTIIIFDNILILAEDYDDLFRKTVLVLERCKQRNVVLKLAKSSFGISKVSFFGYECENGAYRLSQERMEQVRAIPFPSGGKKLQKIQQFIGATVFFKPFIYNYSKKLATLQDMVKKDFNWDESAWKLDYRREFDLVKEEILKALTLVHPNYELPWVLAVDASDLAVGGVLVQVKPDGSQEVIALVSKKLTPPARRWSTIEKECFAIFYSVKKLEYYLFGKQFTILTDHNNLLWMAASEVPKIVRIRIFLQNFSFTLKHVPGRQNTFADWLSRMYSDDSGYETAEDLDVLTVDSADMTKINQIIAQVHNSRFGHHGTQRTWLSLNKFFPGHKIPIRMVQEFVSSCVWCQKCRATVAESLQPPVRSITTEHPRHLLGYDMLYVTPPDSNGFKVLHVFRMLPSRLVALYPAKDMTSESLASAFFLFITTYGLTDILVTDPGSNINSDVVKCLLNWCGVRLRMSLVGRHQSNAVERSHRETLRFLSTLINEERLRNNWANPVIIATVQFIMNSEISKETSVTPFEYVFGSYDAKFFRLPYDISNTTEMPRYLEVLNENLRLVREVAEEVQKKEQQRRLMELPEAGLNSYQIGDMVLVDDKKMGNLKSKLHPRHTGPYEVINVRKADIELKHLVTGKSRVVHMENIKPFFGNREDAYEGAKVDEDQYQVLDILDYQGDPEKRSSMKFLVEFEGNECVWVDFNPDLFQTCQFEDFANKNVQLMPLRYNLEEWSRVKREINARVIEEVAPGQDCFVDLRAWGSDYFRGLELPGVPQVRYVVQCSYVRWKNAGRRKIDLKCELFQQHFEWSRVDVLMYGMNFLLGEATVLVNKEFCQVYPKILE